jgi:hypothetical protein
MQLLIFQTGFMAARISNRIAPVWQDQIFVFPRATRLRAGAKIVFSRNW